MQSDDDDDKPRTVARSQKLVAQTTESQADLFVDMMMMTPMEPFPPGVSETFQHEKTDNCAALCKQCMLRDLINSKWVYRGQMRDQTDNGDIVTMSPIVEEVEDNDDDAEISQNHEDWQLMPRPTFDDPPPGPDQ